MNWLVDYPIILLLVLCLIAFLESIALLGLFIPGALILFSLSALANSIGIHPISLMLAGAIGAITGDICSFIIGKKMQSRMEKVYWFKQHRSWLEQGEWFIKKWGWLSVISGRSLGPLRPVIPLIAGSFNMPTKLFIPLCIGATFIWAPVYLLPGYYTGHLNELWQLQPLGNRSLITLSLTATALSSFALAIYHHTHPERMHLRGLLTRHQADRWPIHSVTLIVLSAICMLILKISPLENIELLFVDFAQNWTVQPSNTFWQSLNSLTNYKLAILFLVTIALWLTVEKHWRLALLLIFFTFLFVGIGYLAVQSGFIVSQWENVIHFGLIIFSIGIAAILASTTFNGLERWPIYLIASFLIVITSASQLWYGKLSITSSGMSIFLAFIFIALFRSAWQITHLPVQIKHISTIMSLECLLVLSWALVESN